MKIVFTRDGTFVTIEKQSDWDNMKDYYCSNCGHNLSNHRFDKLPLTDKTIRVGGCGSCRCKQFKEAKEARYSYV